MGRLLKRSSVLPIMESLVGGSSGLAWATTTKFVSPVGILSVAAGLVAVISGGIKLHEYLKNKHAGV